MALNATWFCQISMAILNDIISSTWIRKHRRNFVQGIFICGGSLHDDDLVPLSTFSSIAMKKFLLRIYIYNIYICIYREKDGGGGGRCVGGGGGGGGGGGLVTGLSKSYHLFNFLCLPDNYIAEIFHMFERGKIYAEIYHTWFR